MNFNLSSKIILDSEKIVGFFDIDNTTTSKHTRNFLYNFNKNYDVITVGKDIPQSFLLYQYKKDEFKIYMISMSVRNFLKFLREEEKKCLVK